MEYLTGIYYVEVKYEGCILQRTGDTILRELKPPKFLRTQHHSIKDTKN